MKPTKMVMTMGQQPYHGVITGIQMDLEDKIQPGLFRPDMVENTGCVTLHGEVYTSDGVQEPFYVKIGMPVLHKLLTRVGSQ